MVRPSPTLARNDRGSKQSFSSTGIATPILNSCLYSVTIAHNDLFGGGLAPLVCQSNAWPAKYRQGFDGFALFTEVSMNLEHKMLRIGLDRRKRDLPATYRAWVSRFKF